jgi:hypothetical protein
LQFLVRSSQLSAIGSEAQTGSVARNY